MRFPYFRHSLPILGLAALLCAAIMPASAQNGPAATRSFTMNVYAADAETLSGERLTIHLWGIDAVTTGIEASRARVFLDDAIQGQAVRCLVISGEVSSGQVRARCLNKDEKDLGLLMVANGQAIANRRDVGPTELAGTYIGAERQARATRIGLWGHGQPQQAAQSQPGPSWLDFNDMPLWMMVSLLMAGPLLGFLVIGFILQVNFRKLIALQKYQIAGTQKREKQLKEREKYVIAAALDNELMTNRAKVDAFLVIYEELLKSLRDPAKKPKYQRAGDIIHEKPALNRTVFDAHIDKLDLLGPQLAAELNALYAMVQPNPDYKTLEPELPIEKAREMVDRIVRQAERLTDPMDRIAGALAVIVRDKRGAVSTAD